jgi:hypothetical protein
MKTELLDKKDKKKIGFCILGGQFLEKRGKRYFS